ncbi:hypothetical protein [Streptomyces amritsarensis]|uniref:hypothetical protein n=1 Tax=Streptomyces amritsarensis TaxID=681158 RepID=UPI003683BFA3
MRSKRARPSIAFAISPSFLAEQQPRLVCSVYKAVGQCPTAPFGNKKRKGCRALRPAGAE